MKFKVDIDFKKGASFCPEIEAENKEAAKKAALDFARGCGFDAQVKKIVVRTSE